MDFNLSKDFIYQVQDTVVCFSIFWVAPVVILLA